MEKVSANHRLVVRDGTYHYRRIVPKHLVDVIGTSVIKYSLKTKDTKEARRRRELADVEWSARFEQAAVTGHAVPAPDKKSGKSIASAEQLVRDYVERSFGRFNDAWITSPPSSDEQRREMMQEADWIQTVLRNPQHPVADELIGRTANEILTRSGRESEAAGGDPDLAELVRRSLIELSRRKLARYRDQYDHDFFDNLFDPTRASQISFGQMAKDYFKTYVEEAQTNNRAPKTIDKIRQNLDLAIEIVGAETPLSRLDYDACEQVRSTLAKTPAHRTKLYADLPLAEAILRADQAGRPRLSSVTQKQYITTLKAVLGLAVRKRLISFNPADSLKPLKLRDDVEEDDVASFDLNQLKSFFNSSFYNSCCPNVPSPYKQPDREWRFWLPLVCLFTGLRINEISQIHVADICRTEMGTHYFDITQTVKDAAKSSDKGIDYAKSVKNSYSRRKIPIHPELVRIGFLKFVEMMKQKGDGPRLFNRLKPNKYGKYGWYPTKRFNETFLPNAIMMKKQQSFHSFRHTFRDALRRADATPDTLKALGAWSQGTLVSDHYGERSQPDHQIRAIEKISYPGLDLSHLYT